MANEYNMSCCNILKILSSLNIKANEIEPKVFEITTIPNRLDISYLMHIIPNGIIITSDIVMIRNSLNDGFHEEAQLLLLSTNPNYDVTNYVINKKKKTNKRAFVRYYNAKSAFVDSIDTSYGEYEL